MDLTKRQQEIFDFIKRYSAEARLSADGARHRQGRRARVVVDGARAPGEPREARAAAPRPVQAARDRAARPRRRRRSPTACAVALGAAAACRSSARSPPASRSSPRRTSRSTSRCPPSPAATEGEYILRVRGESMKDAGILEGDYVVVRPQETADRRRDRRRARRRGGDRQALLPRGRPRPPAARERDDGADPLQGRAGPRPRRRPLPERAMSACRSPDCDAARAPGAVRPGASGAVARAAVDAAAAGPRRQRGGPTLDEMLVGVWEGLRAAHAAVVPGLRRRRWCPAHGAGPAAGATAAASDCGSDAVLSGGRCRCSSAPCAALRVLACGQAVAAGETTLRGKSGHHRAGWSGTDPGKPAGKCHRNTPPMAGAARALAHGKGEMVR